ncbi:hypothetical protein GCM10009827_071570 [Dactylosporangium maewongense]|uniref:Integral membrane protein n=1 Tax=Dactylosporangium maewongense TaxID=634393 RepID=A0ABN2BJF1_9ACTN
MTFRPGFWRAFGFGLAISTALWAVFPLIMLAVAPPPPPARNLLMLGGNAVVYSCTYAACFAFFRWRWCRDWLRISSAGLELASRGSSPMIVRWPAVESVRFTRRWGTPLLEVTPTGPHGVAVLTAGASMPPIRTRDGRDTFEVEIWLTRPGRAVLRSALADHLPSEHPVLAAAGPTR